jgi:hypothetical protein
MCKNDECGATKWLRRIEEMLEAEDGRKFGWAEVLPSLEEWVSTHGHITPKQIAMVERIAAQAHWEF